MNLPENSVQAIAYRHDGSAWGDAFADLPGFACLESCKRDSHSGRYDIVTALPEQRLSVADFAGDCAPWISAVEAALAVDAKQQCRIAIGFLDFETAANSTLHLAYPTLKPAVAAIYSWWVLQDHQKKQAWLVKSSDLSGEIDREVSQRAAAGLGSREKKYSVKQHFVAETSKEDYLEKIQNVRELIAAGDCYQANIAQRFSASYEGDAFAIYKDLRQVAAGDFSAFLCDTSSHAVASFSPERFLSAAAGKIYSQPIKGTRPRSQDPIEDQRIAERLLASEKDRAENIMIVDLLRNDLGKLCQTGSIAVTELCSLHSYNNVHHLVSRVEGELQSGVTPGTALILSSPGGSITGAPKKRAVEIIKSLEKAPRGVYCGSVFVMDGSGWMESSIAIRTLELVNGSIHCWGGGGITWDSEPHAEYQETLDKITGFLRALSP